MEERLSKMDPEKKERLIRASILEFGSHTYEKASTNVIVREADISKGLLYHYFKNKKGLYDYITEYIFIMTTKGIMDVIDFERTDILERIIVITEYKLELFKRYPGILEFAKSIYADKTMEEIKLLIENHAPGFYQAVYTKNIDYGLFKEGVDVQKATKITQWTVEKFSEGLMQIWRETGKIDNDALVEELYGYLEELKKAFYK